MEGGAVGHNFERNIPRTIPARIGLIWFSGFRRDKSNVKVYDVRRTDEDGHQVMAKAHMAFGQVRSKGLDIVYKIQYPY